MNPFLMFTIALMIPVVIIITVFLPFHVSILTTLYVHYGEQVLQYKYQFFTSFELYMRLFEYWQANSGQLDFVSFTLPTIGIPALGILVSLYTTYRLVKYVRDIFTLT